MDIFTVILHPEPNMEPDPDPILIPDLDLVQLQSLIPDLGGSRSDSTTLPQHDCKNKTTETGQLNSITWTGKLWQNSQDRTARAGYSGQDNKTMQNFTPILHPFFNKAK